MIPQPKDKFTALKDKRPWNDIRRDAGYWRTFWAWKHATTCPSGKIFKFKEVSNG